MDFFKSCKTNVHRVSQLSEWKGVLFVRAQENNREQVMHDVLAKLRNLQVLCASVGRDLWIFLCKKEDENDTAQQLNALSLDKFGFALHQSTTLGAEPAEIAADGQLLQDLLLQAIEAALSFSLTQENGCFHVAPWTWVLCAMLGEPCLALHLHAYIPSSGALHVTATTEGTNFTIMAEHESSDHVQHVLIPGGHRIDLIDEVQGSIAGEQLWKERVASRLRAIGTVIENGDPWLRIRLKDSAQYDDFLWPSQLVLSVSTWFRSLNVDSDFDLKQWFTSANDVDGYQSPLIEAESWLAKLSDCHDGDELANSDQALPNLSDTEGQTGSKDLGTMLETSPPFNQRNADQQAAMVGIYPTPPDGLAPGHTQSQHPSQDHITALSSVDSSSIGNELLASTDVQHENHENNHALDSINAPTMSFPSNVDDLFGEMGEMDDYTREEVGDADFSFFDEPDGMASPELLTDLEMADEPQKVTVIDDAEQSASLDPQTDVMLPVAQTKEARITPTTSGGQSEVAHTEPVSISGMIDNDDLDRPISARSLPVSEHEKPLSPFGIRERLLPPPIPASAQRHGTIPASTLRRSSTFDAVVFNEGLESTFEYPSCAGHSESADPSAVVAKPSISLPARRRRVHSRPELSCKVATVAEEEDSESEEDFYESDSSLSVPLYAPKLPWYDKKRKREHEEDAILLTNDKDNLPWSNDTNSANKDEDEPSGLLETLLDMPTSTTQTVFGLHKAGYGGLYIEPAGICGGPNIHPEDKPSSCEVLLGLGKLDIVYVAQLISEQALGCSPAFVQAVVPCEMGHKLEAQGSSAVFQARAGDFLSEYLPSAENCDVSSLALAKERITPVVPARPGQPRLPQRNDILAIGPEIFSFPAPFVRVRRGQETYEMLPPALEFWGPLSLGPPNGSKNVKAFCVLPSNPDLRSSTYDFIDELGSAYESCKLGTHQHGSFPVNDSNTFKADGAFAVVETDNGYSPNAILQAYSSVCLALGTLLSTIGHPNVGQTIVIYMIDPFYDVRASQTLCACFWLLYKAYRESIHKKHRGQPYSDIVLQILPIALIAKPHVLSTLNRREMTTLAKEVYDRCPPSADAQKAGYSSYQQFSGPFIELAPVLPRKIQFQLTGDPPSDLLHEGSVLHIAYATSGDHHWMNVYWVNATGSYQRSSAFPLRGKSYAEIIEEVWDQTREAMMMRAVMWRIFILSSDADIDQSVQQCWRKIVAERPRKQILSITLLSAQTHLPINLIPPSCSEESSSNLLTGTFPTPATTPSGTALTASPDTNPHSGAPLTPAPSESIVPIETDPDAHLVDIADETVGILFANAYVSPSALASGALFKRGNNDNGGKRLPSLGVSVLWTVHVRPTGQVDEGNTKHAEMTLKDVLRMYRGLAVLTKAKGLVMQDDDAAAPIHLVAVMRAARALDGLLR